MTTAAREHRVAVVVVHGIGFQRPFETLDKVAVGLVPAAAAVYPGTTCDVAVRRSDVPALVATG